MGFKRHKPGEIVSKLRQVEVLVGQGRARADAIREIFTSLREARILIEAWHRHYNTARPHSALGYRPPATGNHAVA